MNAKVVGKYSFVLTATSQKQYCMEEMNESCGQQSSTTPMKMAKVVVADTIYYVPGPC
jgi:uncharacterized protein YabE (DUF348 family)